MTGVIRYDSKTALLLAQVCALTYRQYQQGQKNADYDGTITPPAGYRQIAAFKAPEIYFRRQRNSAQLYPTALNPGKVKVTDRQALEASARFINKTFWGFALTAINGSGDGIIAFRGTESPYEWVMNADLIQTELPTEWFPAKKLGVAKVHDGFLTMFAFLRDQILKAVQQFSRSGVCYVTGHSLGGALAILAALNIDQSNSPGEEAKKTQMYNFAGPRVGDPVFANLYDEYLPASYRIVNLADIVPTLPPAQILNYHYQHIGLPIQEWSYLHQTGDIADNHSLENNYLPALEVPFKVNNLRLEAKWIKNGV